MNQAAEDLMRLFAKWCEADKSTPKHLEEYLRRGLVCTPFDGNYGKVAGWVICVNGSPPKGTLVVYGVGPPNSPAYYLGTRCKRISAEKQSQIIRAFCDLHIKNQEKPFTIMK